VTTTVHHSPEALAAWVDGVAPPPLAMSVEQHLTRCAGCREALASMLRAAPRPALPDPDRTWDRVRDAVVLPPPGRVARALRRVGLPESDAVLLVSSPSLRLSWWWSLAVVLVFVLLATGLARHGWTTSFLAIAPVVPVVGVALAYGPASGPQVEQVAATPYPPLRLVLLRTAAVLTASIPLAVLAGLLLPEQVSHWWLLPAGGFTAATLGLSSWVRPSTAALVIAVGWMAAVSAAARWSSADLVLQPALLVGYGLLLVLGPVLLVRQVRRLGTLGRISP
jgi:hypothetical protein